MDMPTITFPVKTFNSLYHIDYLKPINNPSDFRTSTKISHDYYPQLSSNFDCRVPFVQKKGLVLSDPTLNDAVKYSEYKRNFDEKIVEDPSQSYPRCGTYANVHYTRNVQEKIFQNPPKPRSHFISEMHENYTIKEPIRDYDEVLAPEPYAKCEVKALGRDEQPKIRPEEKGFYKWLDPYMTTYAVTHCPFTKNDWEGLSKKDILTFYDIVKAPKAKGFGPKNPPDITPLISKKNYYMQDNAPFNLKIQEKLTHTPPKAVPHKGLTTTTSETHSSLTKYPLWSYLDHTGVSYPEPLSGTSKFQDLCAPGMYRTEYETLGSGDNVNAVIDTDKHLKMKNIL